MRTSPNSDGPGTRAAFSQRRNHAANMIFCPFSSRGKFPVRLNRDPQGLPSSLGGEYPPHGSFRSAALMLAAMSIAIPAWEVLMS